MESQEAEIVRLISLLSSGTDAQHAAGELRVLARSTANQQLIFQSGGIPPLVLLLRSAVPDAQLEAAKVLSNLAYDNADNQTAIAQAGGIPPLVLLLVWDEPETVAIFLRRATSSEHVGAQFAGAPPTVTGLAPGGVASRGGIMVGDIIDRGLFCVGERRSADDLAWSADNTLELRVRRLRSSGIPEVAAHALEILAHSTDNQARIREAGGVVPLVALLCCNVPDVQEAAADTLSQLACGNVENQVAIAKAGGIAPLVALLSSNVEDVQGAAAVALRSLAHSSTENKAAIRTAGGAQLLVEILGRRCALPLVDPVIPPSSPMVFVITPPKPKITPRV